MLEFRALGPIEVTSNGTPMELPKGMDRVLLAVLVLAAPRAVPADELIEALWRERAPATAPEMIRNSVARLRARIGQGALETTSAGYRLVAAEETVDVRRFERLGASGAQALETGDAALASAELREALVLWRGRPLPELDDSPAYAPQLRALEELRLRVEEDRMEAELALGRAVLIVPSLEALHEEHPYRERLLGQLMLALYRAGRQKDALDRYTSARRRLVDEVGLQPAPELQELQKRILRQDPGLVDTARRDQSVESRPETAVRMGGRRRVLLATAVLVAAGAAAAIVAAWPRSRPVRIPARGLVALRAASGRPKAATELHIGPGLLAVDAEHVWVASSDGPSVLEISSQNLVRPRVVHIPHTAFSLAAAGGSLWVGNSFDGTISRIDGRGRVVRTFRPEPHAEGRLPIGAAAGGGLWVASQDGTLTRLDPASGRRLRTYRGVGLAQAIAAGSNTVWIADARADVVEHFDARVGRVVGRVQVGGRAGPVIVGDGSVWALASLENTLSRIDPERNAVVEQISVPSETNSLAATPGRIWVGSAGGLLLAIDTGTNKIVKTESLGQPIDALATVDGVVWASVG
jgi:DNA-binding SARP family transcriptional activator